MAVNLAELTMELNKKIILKIMMVTTNSDVTNQIIGGHFFSIPSDTEVVLSFKPGTLLP